MGTVTTDNPVGIPLRARDPASPYDKIYARLSTSEAFWSGFRAESWLDEFTEGVENLAVDVVFGERMRETQPHLYEELVLTPDKIAGTLYERYPEELRGLRTELDFMRRLRFLKNREEDRESFHRGGLAGMLGGFGGALLDPINIVPFAAGAKARTLSEFVVNTSKAATMGAATQEVVLAQVDPLRTKEEFVFGTLSGTVLGGALGVLGFALGSRARARVLAMYKESIDPEGGFIVHHSGKTYEANDSVRGELQRRFNEKGFIESDEIGDVYVQFGDEVSGAAQSGRRTDTGQTFVDKETLDEFDSGHIERTEAQEAELRDHFEPVARARIEEVEATAAQIESGLVPLRYRLDAEAGRQPPEGPAGPDEPGPTPRAAAGAPAHKVESVLDDIGEIDEATGVAADKLARDSEINITSDRELVNVVRDADGKVIGAQWRSASDEVYEFDVVVDPAHQGTGVGASLIDDGIAGFDELTEVFPDIKMRLSVTSDVSEGALVRRGFKVVEGEGSGIRIMELDASAPTPRAADELLGRQDVDTSRARPGEGDEAEVSAAKAPLQTELDGLAAWYDEIFGSGFVQLSKSQEADVVRALARIRELERQGVTRSEDVVEKLRRSAKVALLEQRAGTAEGEPGPRQPVRQPDLFPPQFGQVTPESFGGVATEVLPGQLDLPAKPRSDLNQREAREVYRDIETGTGRIDRLVEGRPELVEASQQSVARKVGITAAALRSGEDPTVRVYQFFAPRVGEGLVPGEGVVSASLSFDGARSVGEKSPLFIMSREGDFTRQPTYRVYDVPLSSVVADVAFLTSQAKASGLHGAKGKRSGEMHTADELMQVAASEEEVRVRLENESGPVEPTYEVSLTEQQRRALFDLAEDPAMTAQKYIEKRKEQGEYFGVVRDPEYPAGLGKVDEARALAEVKGILDPLRPLFAPPAEPTGRPVIELGPGAIDRIYSDAEMATVARKKAENERLVKIMEEEGVGAATAEVRDRYYQEKARSEDEARAAIDAAEVKEFESLEKQQAKVREGMHTLFDDIREGRTPEDEIGEKSPLLSHLKIYGVLTVEPHVEGGWTRTNLAGELANMGVTSKTHPGLFIDPRRRAKNLVRRAETAMKRDADDAAARARGEKPRKRRKIKYDERVGIAHLDAVHWPEDLTATVQRDSQGNLDIGEMSDLISDEVGGIRRPILTELDNEKFAKIREGRFLMEQELDRFDINIRGDWIEPVKISNDEVMRMLQEGQAREELALRQLEEERFETRVLEEDEAGANLLSGRIDDLKAERNAELYDRAMRITKKYGDDGCGL